MTSMARFATLSLVALPLLAACGGSSSGGAAAGSSSLSAYAHKVCSSVSGPIARLKSDNTAYEAKVKSDEGSGGLTAIKADTENYFTEVVAQFTAIRNGVSDAGTPDTSQGAEVRSKLLAGFNQLVTVAKNAQSDVKTLSTSNAQSFSSQLEADGQKLETAGSSVGNQLDSDTNLGGASLEKAFNSDSACQSLSSQ